MKKRALVVMLLLALVSLVVGVPLAAWAAPSISLSPSSGTWGATIGVSGSGFSKNTNGYVWFDTDGDAVRDTGEPAQSVRTTNAGAIRSGTTLTAPTGVAVAVYQVRADIPTGGSVEASAPFTIVPPAITASAGANGTITPSGNVAVNYGASQAFNIAADTGYHVADVLVDSSSVGAVSSYEFTNVTVDHTISASFAVDGFIIVASAGANGTITPSGNVAMNYGASQAFNIAADTGCHIADVLVDGSSVGAVSSYEFTNVTADHTISASFAVDTYTHTITASAGSNGSISPSGSVTVDHGGNQSFTITADTGYHVADVVVDGASVGPVTSYTFTNVIDNHTIVASYAVNVYTILASAGVGGTISPSGHVWLVYGSSQGFVIVTNPGCYIADVLVDGSSVGAVSSYEFTNIASDHTISVSFVQDTNPPPVPTLVFPAAWSKASSSQSLEWSAVSDPAGVTYELKLYDSSWFLLSQNSGLTSSVCPLSNFGSLPDGIYYWKVRAWDGAGNASAWPASWAFKLANTIPGVPVHVSPSTYSRVTSSSSLDWSDVSDPMGVTYQVNLYNSSWSLVASQSGLASSDCVLASFGSLADGVYFWKVRAVDGGGISGDWSTSWAFKMANTIPSVPVHQSPANYAKVTGSTLLDWTDVSDPEGVTYQCSLYNSSWSLVASQSGLASSDCAVNSFGFLADGIYFWKVRAVDGAGIASDWSTSWAFKLANTIPSIPVHLSPSNWTRVNSSGSLDWADVSDPEGVMYELKLCDSSWLVVATRSGLASSDCALSSFGALADGTYFWRVRAIDGGGISSDWSVSWAFRLDNTVPAVPVLVSPGNGGSTSGSPTLDWSDVTDASGARYQVQLDDNPDFSSPLLDQPFLSASEYTMAAGETLPAGTYYWKVRAVDGAGNASAWTSTWSFTVV